jgi:hypothetical protein
VLQIGKWYNPTMKKLYPRDYQLEVKQVGDHLTVHIMPLNITVETAPGKLAQQDAMDAAYLAIEQSLLQEQESRADRRAVAQ